VRGACRVAAALSRRYSREKVSVVVSRFDRHSDISANDIEQAVHAPLRFTFPSDYRLALQALNAGRPFVLDGSSKLATAVLEFAKSLNGEPLAGPAAKSGTLRERLGSLRWLTS